MGIVLLSLLILCHTLSIGAFGPLLPEIARVQRLGDWELGVLAGAFGFARVVFDLPAGRLATRRLGTTLVAAVLSLLAGVLLLGSAGPLALLVLGRFLIGMGHAFGMVGGLTALLERSEGAGLRLNVFEFSAMLGVLGGTMAAGLLPATWAWNQSLLVACSPQLVILALLPMFRHHFPDRRGRGPAPARGPRAEVASWTPIVIGMFGVGTVFAFAWSSVSQFLIPLRAAREFGLGRAETSWVLVLFQVVDLIALLPVGYLADRLGRRAVLAAICLVLGGGTAFVSLGPFPVFVLGAALFGLGMAGWMLPLGLVRDNTPIPVLGWRMGLYRIGVDAGIFLGPLVSGFLGDLGASYFVAGIALVTLVAGAWLLKG